MSKHNNKRREIRNDYERAGWKCQEEFSIPRDDGSDGKIDLVCVSGRQIRGFEIESNSQVIRNSRDLKKLDEIFRKKGLNSKSCQLGSEEDWRKVCRR